MFKITMDQIIKNAVNMENTLSFLRNELSILKKAYNEVRIKTLVEENCKLTNQVEDAKKKLIQLETSHGIKQIFVPNTRCTLAEKSSLVQSAPAQEPKVQATSHSASNIEGNKDKAPKKEKKKVEKKPVAEQNELSVDVGRLDLRVGQIMQVDKHPDADSLYVSKIQCGDSALRTVVSGLVKFIPISELQNRKVVVLCNLKPVKMRGVNSEAMVMCASTPEVVEVLSPPADAQPGDIVECEGYVRQPDAQLNPKKKIFETVAPDLKTNDTLQATYKSSIIYVAGKGPITTKSLKNVNIK